MEERSEADALAGGDSRQMCAYLGQYEIESVHERYTVRACFPLFVRTVLRHPLNTRPAQQGSAHESISK